MGENNGRDARGYFAAGNKFSKGNLGNARMKELRRALLECGTPERVAAVEKTLYQAAVGGDVAAIRVWLEHMVGKPVQAVEVSGPDGSAIGLADVVSAVMEALGDDMDARVRIAAAFRRLGGDGGGLG